MSMTMGGLDRMQGISIEIRADSTSLRQQLSEASRATQTFKKDTEAALSGAGASASGMEQNISRSAKGVGTSLSSTGETAKVFGEQTRRGMREAADATEELNRSGSGSLNSFGGVMARFLGPAALAGMALQIGKVGFGFHDFMQKNELAFETMLGSAGEAKEFLADILDFAKQTPFSFPELTASAQKMVAFGVESDKVVGILQTLGDATVGAGKGMADLDGVASVIGQISAKGRLQSQEILQLAERGIPALAVLANMSGQTVEEFQKSVTAGAVDADTAITNLVDGLRDGTDGVAGATAAYGGLMEKVKESGGITATLDSTKSGFRNMAAAITESLIPSLVDLLNVTQDVMKVIKTGAELFGKLPAPVRNATTAFVAFVAINKLLKLNLGTSSLRAWNIALSTTTTATHAATRATGALATAQRLSIGAFNGAKASLKGVGSAAFAALGGPLGIAVAGASLAVAGFANQSARAKQESDGLKATLDATTGAVTDQTREFIQNQLAMERSAETDPVGDLFKGKSSLLNDAEEMGIAIEDVVAAWEGQEDAIARVREQASAYYHTLNAADHVFTTKDTKYAKFTKALDNQEKAYADNAKILAAKNKLDQEGTKTTEELGAAYREAALSVEAFTEDQQKAIDKAEETARKAFDSTFNTSNMDLNVSTLDDLAKAEDGVTQANRRVRDSEESLSDTRARKDVKTSDIRKAEEALADARKAAGEAADSLADVESRRDPVKQYKEQLAEMQKSAEKFRDDIVKLGELGLNAGSLMEIQTMGPEKAKDSIDALLKDKSLIGDTNAAREMLDGIGIEMQTITGVLAASAERGGTLTGEEFTLAMAIAAEEGSAVTVQAIADKLGEDKDTIRKVGADFGFSFLEGLTDYIDRNAVDMMRVLDPEGLWRDVDGSIRGGGTGTGGGGRGGGRGGSFFSGGIIPGYTPGRDTMNINVGGGEAIMRPEWTRAMTPGYVHKMNSIARSGGVDAVRSAMQGFGGSFYNGGIAGQGSSPQIIEVPVTSRVENHGVTTFGDIYAADLADIKRAARKSRRGAFTGGRPL